MKIAFFRVLGQPPRLWGPAPRIKRLLIAALVLLPVLSGGAVRAQTTDSVIDVAVFYTPAAKTAWSWTTKLEAETAIQDHLTSINVIYADSGVKQRLNLVAVEEVAGYVEASIGAMDLGRLVSPSDGHMDEVHAIRDRVWADAVILIRSYTGGIASLMTDESTDFASEAFGVSGAYPRTIAHELGHTHGAAS